MQQQPSTHHHCSPKRPKMGDSNVETLLNSDCSFRVEHCNIHLRPGFSVAAIAYNGSNGRLCVIRRSDNQPGKQVLIIDYEDY